MTQDQRSRVVVVSPYAPGARDAGERRRLGALLDAIQLRYQLTLLHWESEAIFRVDPPQFDTRTPPSSVRAKRRLTSLDYLRAGVGNSLAQWHAVKRQAALMYWVGDELTRLAPQAVLAVQLPGVAALPGSALAKTMVDTHNSEGLRWRRIAQTDALPAIVRIGARQQARAASRIEQGLAQQVARMLAVSPGDVEYFQALGARTSLIPNGFDPPKKLPGRQPDRAGLKLLFLGSLGYSANLDALTWLVEIAANLPSYARISVVGSGEESAARNIVKGSPAIDFIGQVANVSDAYFAHDALVVPLRMGGGSRLKILEAMAHGLPVISTRAGAEGLGLIPGRHYLLADRSSDWTEEIGRFKEDLDLRAALASAARMHVEAMTWSASGETLVDVIETVISDRD